jgi:predicted Rossmann-fold nucleotide-binding protein
MPATMTAGMRYVTDVDGETVGVILSLEQNRRLLEDVHDLAVVANRLDQESITLEELKERLTLSPC